MYYVESIKDDSHIYIRDTSDNVLECYTKEVLFSIISTYSQFVHGVAIPKISAVTCLSLLNKDELIAHLIADNSGNIIDYEFISSMKPYTFNGDFNTWLSGRLLINERTDIKDFFEYIGIKTYIEYASITSFVSLTDTYWVKICTDTDKSWKDVSPYINEFNDAVAHYSFNGKIESKYVGGSSPDLSLGGSFPKCWRRKNNQIEMVKAGTTFASNCGREPFSEIYVAQLEKYLGVYAYLPYRYVKYKGLDCTACKLMTSEKIGLISARDLLKTKCTSYLDLFKLLSNEDIKHLKEMLCIDILTVNIDRHFGNIGFFIDNETQEVIGLSPIFDNNLALVPYYDEPFNGDLYEYINTLCSKDGTDFIELYKGIRDEHTDKLMKKALKFKFNVCVESQKVGVERVSLFNKIVNYQAKRCLQ